MGNVCKVATEVGAVHPLPRSWKHFQKQLCTHHPVAVGRLWCLPHRQVLVLLKESHQRFLLPACLLRDRSLNQGLSLGKLNTAMTVLTDDSVHQLFSSCPPPFNLKKYKWPCASEEDLNMFVPYDVSKMEL